MRACNVSSGQSVPIYANFSFETAKQKTKETGLLDSGATVTVVPGPPPAVGRTLVSVLPEGGPG